MNPSVIEIQLKEEYPFMYENCIISTPFECLLLLQTKGDQFSVLKFHALQFKYGYPNDEGGHYLSKHGLGYYGIFEVQNSPWLQEINTANEKHHHHSPELFKEFRHFICRLQDVTFEVLSKTMEETTISYSYLQNLIMSQFDQNQQNGG